MKAFEDDAIARLRAALREDASGSAPGGCPTRDDLWRSAAGELVPQEDERIVLHLARCGECSVVWRLAREMLAAELTDHSVVAFPDPRPSRRWRRFLVPAAAAAILIGVGLTTRLLLPSDPSPPVFREQRTEVILASPGTHLLPRAACHLEWSAGPEGTRYDLIATDENLEILVSVQGLQRPEHTLPEHAIPVATRELLWRVTARLPDGRTISSATFSTALDDPLPTQD